MLFPPEKSSFLPPVRPIWHAYLLETELPLYLQSLKGFFSILPSTPNRAGMADRLFLAPCIRSE